MIRERKYQAKLSYQTGKYQQAVDKQRITNTALHFGFFAHVGDNIIWFYAWFFVNIKMLIGYGFHLVPAMFLGVEKKHSTTVAILFYQQYFYQV